MLRPYRVTQFDSSFVEIAARFHLPNVRSIMEQNPDFFPTGGEDVDTIPPSALGQTLQIPFPDDYASQWDWGTYHAHAGESLASVCAKMNKDPRIDPRHRGKAIGTPPWLTPDYLLNLFENADVRGGHGGNASSVHLAAGELVNIPFPQVAARSRVIATSHGLPTSFEVEPPWIVELTSQYHAFSDQARRLENMIAGLRSVQHEAAKEVSRLEGMRHVLDILEAHPAKPRELLQSEFQQLAALDKALKNLSTVAKDKLVAHVLTLEVAPAYNGAVKLAQSLFSTVHSSDLYTLAQKLRDQAARYPRVVNEFCAALSYAYEVLGDSPIANTAMADVEACVRFVAGAKPVSSNAFASVDPALASAIDGVTASALPATALASMTSLIRNLGGAASVSIGDLPGPFTLGVALYRLWGAQIASKAVAAATTTTTTTVITSQTAILVRFTRNAFAEDDSSGEEILIAIAEVRTRSTFTITTAPSASFRSDILERYAHPMSSARWSGALAITGVFVLVFSVGDMIQKGVNAADVIGGVGGIATTVLGAVKIFAKLSESAELGLARGAAVLGIVLSAASLIEDLRTGADWRGDALQTGGAVLLGAQLLFAAMVPEPFSIGLAIAGGLLIIAGIAYSLLTDDGIRDLIHMGLFPTNTKKWFVGQARTFMLGPHYLAQKGALGSWAKQVEDATLDADFFYVDKGQRDALTPLLNPDELQMMFQP